jgi:hypothetical protein
MSITSCISDGNYVLPETGFREIDSGTFVATFVVSYSRGNSFIPDQELLCPQFLGDFFGVAKVDAMAGAGSYAGWW